MSDPASHTNIHGRLEALGSELAASNSSLYRHLALYLQVLREVLPGRVDQACFHLATQVHPARYTALPGVQRQQLHRRLQALVHRCCSLLTVEQLAGLAAQIARERERQESPPEEASTMAEEGAPFPVLPEGSVRLGMTPPLTGGTLGWERLGPFLSPLPGSAGGEQAGPDDGEEEGPGEFPPSSELDAASFLLQAFGEALAGGAGVSEADHEVRADREAIRHEDEAAGTEEEWESDSFAAALWQEGRLPRDPILLLRWLEGIEQALTRRLRNLSHALNVEFLRLGISLTLLPVSLLDAVLGGRIETMAAPANLLRMQLPLAMPPALASAEAIALLLRSADLEMEEPRLRTCRRRLQQHRQEVRRMAHQYRRLQRRLQAHEAEQLWLQDTRTSRANPQG